MIPVHKFASFRMSSQRNKPITTSRSSSPILSDRQSGSRQTDECRLNGNDRNGTVVLVGMLGWFHYRYLAESIQQAGFRVKFISPDETAFSELEWIERISVDDLSLKSLADHLLAVARDDSVRWIMPLHEDAIWACRTVLPDNPKTLPNISAVDVARLENKRSMCKFASQLGIRVPRELELGDVSAAREASSQLGFPCVVKGEGGMSGSQVAICNNLLELEQACTRLSTVNPVLQEYISGKSWGAGGFFFEGRPIRIHLYEILEQVPATGPPTRIRHDAQPVLRDTLFALARELKWTGFMQADFIRSAEGQFHFLEINPRPWASMVAACAAGGDLFGPLVQVLHGQQPIPDLDNRDGWRGYIFPKPVWDMSFSGNLIDALKIIVTPEFWRSIPYRYGKTNHLLLKSLYWAFSIQFRTKIRLK